MRRRRMSRGRKRGAKKDRSFFSMSVQVVCGSLLSVYSTNEEETLTTKHASCSNKTSVSSLVKNTRIC